MRPIFGQCKNCNNGEEARLVSRTSGLCIRCYYQAKREKLKSSGVKKIKLLSDKQKEVNKKDEKFFRRIWKDRPHKSEVSGDLLPDKMERFYMSHVLSKGAYPKFRHYDKNILLMTKQEHVLYEFGIPTGEKWEKVLSLKQSLIEEYNNQ